uniref:PPC domain-containing protein n=1 Tax=Oryza punctata TaxID=4537 RepID=A0A0E0K7J9_ORYPU
MTQDVASKCETRSRSGAAPEIMRSPRRRRHHQLKCSDGNLGELRVESIPNFHCKSLPTRSCKTNAEDSIVGKRGSMYQSSSEISMIRKLHEGRRKKIDSALDGDAFLSFEIVDSSSQPSTSGAYLFSHQNCRSEAKSSVESRRIHRASRDFLDLSFRELPDENCRLDRPRMDCTLLKNDAGDGFLEISLEEEVTKGPCGNASPQLIGGESSKGTEANCLQNKISVCPSESNCSLRERNSTNSLPESMSAKVSISDGTCPSESVRHGIENSTKVRSSPFKKILDPIMKSKSIRSPSLMEDSNYVTMPVNRKKCVSRKSLLNDFSRSEQSQSIHCQLNGERQHTTNALSPAHLQAVLKLDTNNGIPVFEFCVEGPEESISARSWKTGNDLNWIYTFHSGGKRASAAGRASKDGRWCSPPIVGQMQVSSYLCSEVGKDGVLTNSVITEFVLYDIAHARRTFSVEEKTQCTETTQSTLSSAIDKSASGDCPQRINLMDQQNSARNNSDVSTSCPWSEEDLYPHLEIAATVIQVPFNRSKSKELKNGLSPGTVKVVTPSGLHGLPNDDEASPSPLLDRWRYGGGCDCGGWDMACPIAVLGNAYDNNWANSVTKEGENPMELFVLGGKEELPALSIKGNEKGQLLVHFHARLSALQAFSTCISLLHCSEASTAVSIEKGKHKLYSSSLKMLLEEEVSQLIEAVTAEEKRKTKKRRQGQFSGLHPHLLQIDAGEEIIPKITALSKSNGRMICVLSVLGAVQEATLILSSGVTTYHKGPLEIIRLFGSILTPNDQGCLRVTLASGDSSVIGGVITGPLKAATPVQAVVASFYSDVYWPNRAPKITAHYPNSQCTIRNGSPLSSERVNPGYASCAAVDQYESSEVDVKPSLGMLNLASLDQHESSEVDVKPSLGVLNLASL